jgi:hypothetical protein
MKLLRIFAVILIPALAIAGPFLANAADVTVAWDANYPPVAGYGIYWDTVNQTSGFTNSEDVPTGTQYTVTGLIVGTTYYFAVDAYDAEGNRSSYSNILEYVVEAERVIIRIIDRPKGVQIIWDGN